MKIERWALIRDDVLTALRSEVTRIQPREKLGGWKLCEIEFDRHQLRELQARPGVRVVPSLTAPAARLPQAMLDILTQEGVVLDPADDVQQALRKLRNARGHQNNYDIDKAF